MATAQLTANWERKEISQYEGGALGGRRRRRRGGKKEVCSNPCKHKLASLPCTRILIEFLMVRGGVYVSERRGV